MTDRQVRIFPGTEEAGTVRVRVARLADLVEPGEIALPALLKLDVQGYELAALEGCEDLLDRFFYVYVECSYVELYQGQPLVQDVVMWLERHDFSLSGAGTVTKGHDGSVIQADLLFRRKGAEALSAGLRGA